VCLGIAAYAALYVALKHGVINTLLADKYVNYRFSSFEDGRFYRVGPSISAGGEVIEGDIGNELKFCPVKSDWICLESNVIKFAVPRRALKVGDHWRFSNVDYTLLPSYQEMIPGGPAPNTEAPLWPYRILGRQYELYVIKANHHDSKEWSQIFLFSPDHGLVGYMTLSDASTKDDERNETFWLTDENGPGSNEFDTNIASSAFMPVDNVMTLLK